LSDSLTPVLCEVNSVQQNAADVFTLDIEPPPDWPGFQPGQFNMLYAPGVGEAAISLSGDPNDSYRLVHTIRAVGNVTRKLQQLDQHSTIGVRGPFGRPWPVFEAVGKDLVMIAGGIGMAPLRPVIYSVLENRAAFNRVHVIYGARTPPDILYEEELVAWHSQHEITTTVTVDVASPSWKGDVGVVTRYISRSIGDPANTVALVCGPEIMMRFSATELLAAGLPVDHIYVSMERSMKCATAFCGHCQLGPYLVCRDGPVFPYQDLESLMVVEQF